MATQKYNPITLDMILRSTSLARGRSETATAYLKRVTHLHLQNKKIKQIEGLEKCSNLKVIIISYFTIILLKLITIF